MKNKVVIGLIIVGIIFLGSVTYALFNENLLLNDVASDIQTNDTTQSNNQLNIQNNQSNNIISGENSNFVPNNMANVILNGISDNSVVNEDVGQKVVKERLRVTVNNETQIFYDDGSFIVIRDNHAYYGKDVLTRIYDTNDMDGGYIQCAECTKFIPVGNVSGLVPEDYLCNCTNTYSVNSVKDVPFVYSEEDVLEHIKINGFNNAFDDSSNVDMNIDVDINSSNDVNQNSTVINNNIDKPEFKIPDDFKLPNTNPWEVDIENYHGMDMNNHRNIFVFDGIPNNVSGD